jgi:hypothetical protein
MRLLAALILPGLLASCVVTGNSSLKVQVIDQKSRKPHSGEVVTAHYVTNGFVLAKPGHIERLSDESGSVEFMRVAYGVWSIRLQGRDHTYQDAWFSIYDGQLSIPAPADERTADGGVVGRTLGNWSVKPPAPLIFYGKLPPINKNKEPSIR